MFFSAQVVGVGGGGSNAVKRMMESEIEGVEFWSLNTDVQVGRLLFPFHKYRR